MNSQLSNDKLIEILRNWQKLEDAAVANTTEIIKNSRNPFIQIIMEIIRQDSVMHRRIQQLIIDSLEMKDFAIDPSEIELLWEKIEEHDEMEKKVVKIAEIARNETSSPVVRYLLDYLLEDEQKHDNLLIKLDHYSSMIQEGKINSEITSTFGLVADQLEKDVKLTNPEKAIETDERIKTSAMQLEQASELMGGDLESDLGIDLDEEFAEFEAEMAAKEAGKLVDVPETEESSISVIDDDEELEGMKDKDQIMKEMEKLKKELG